MFNLPENILNWIKNPTKSYSNYFYIENVEFNGFNISKLQKAALERQYPELFDQEFLCFTYQNKHYICKRFNHFSLVLEHIQEHLNQSKSCCFVGTGYVPNEFFKTESEEASFHNLSIVDRMNHYISHIAKNEELKDIVRQSYRIDQIS